MTVARPAIDPVSRPTNFGFFSMIQARISQVTAANEAAMSVLRNASDGDRVDLQLAAGVEAVPAEPQQPGAEGDERDAVRPLVLTTFRRPTKNTEASAAMPAMQCTTMPPAKSRTPLFCRIPPPQIMWANGK